MISIGAPFAEIKQPTGDHKTDLPWYAVRKSENFARRRRDVTVLSLFTTFDKCTAGGRSSNAYR